ncbi:MAG: hypothetical protein FJY88_07540 [Candidatus Eisenbacteria bacterium]|nr:hypothetical protein [Candidatus Eisenbacteria bacterium]
MKRLLLVFCALAMTASFASADVPDPSRCSTTWDPVQRFYLCPDNYPDSNPDGANDCSAASFSVTVANASGAIIPNAVVEILLGGSEPGGSVEVCVNQTLTRNTESNGVAKFNLGGGGCNKRPGCAVIRANGVVIRTWNVIVSADYVGTDNLGQPGLSDGRVAPADFSVFVGRYQGGVGASSCHDYNNNGTTGPEDFSVFVAAYKGGVNICTLVP